MGSFNEQMGGGEGRYTFKVQNLRLSSPQGILRALPAKAWPLLLLEPNRATFSFGGIAEGHLVAARE